MIVEDQSEVIEYLSRSAAYGLDEPVERIDTHGAIVFLAGERAYKLKRAVKFPYMDFSSVSRRRVMCETEIEINRRTAPQLYLGVVPITVGDGGLAIGGTGEALDWLVVMRRFPQSALFDHMAAEGSLDNDLMRQLARVIARFHEQTPPRTDHGGSVETKHVIDGISRSFEEVETDIPVDEVADLLSGLVAKVEQFSQLIDSRVKAGKVRHCHGDLHLRNICLVDERPTLFDAIEFNDEIAVIDVLYDLAFLIMDLEHRRLRPFANTIANGYLGQTHDYGGLTLLPLFLAMRAAIRAHVTATIGCTQDSPNLRSESRAEALAYLGLSVRMLSPRQPALLAVAGLSGSGKSTLGYGLAPGVGRCPGAIVLRSDEIRKETMGVDSCQHLGPDGYRPEVSKRVYSTMHRRANEVLRSGHAVICDAVYNQLEERLEVESVARNAHVPFLGIWLEASRSDLIDRVTARRDDASDATVEIVQSQLETDPGAITWCRVDATGSIGDVIERAQFDIRASNVAVAFDQDQCS